MFQSSVMARSTGTTRLFVDEATIHVRGGKGGNGCVSFRREKYVPKGGPDGGDGGHGGSVFLVAHAGVNTLLDLTGRHHYHAENGRPGSGSNCAGRRGKPLRVTVPAGTLVYDADTGRLLKDLVNDGNEVCVARGGRGGRGNAHFVSATHQVPRESQPGTAGQERKLRLELKLIADVGFVGLPNAGKSTLLSRLTHARPKIAAYPFTTREPYLGIAEMPGFRRLVLADLPGLIAGAHEGAGLGDTFLRHIERTRVILHLVDLNPPEGAPSPAEAYQTIRGELEKYSATLAQRTEILVGTKLDITEARDAFEPFQVAVGRPVLGISSASGQGLRELLEALWTVVDEARREEQAAPLPRIELWDAADSDNNDDEDDDEDDSDADNDDDDDDADDAPE